MSNLIQHPSADEFKQLLKEEKLVLVDFFATWCMPCSMLAPVMEEIAEEYKGKVTVCKIDIDQNESLASEYGIQTIPTVMLFKNSTDIDTIIGLNDKDRYRSVLDANDN